MSGSSRIEVPSTPLLAPAEITALQDAVRRAQRVLWQTQREDGAWESMGDMGPSPTAQVVVALHHLGRLDPQDAAEAARWLRSQQRKDGSFILYPFARKGDVGATACVWAALHVTAPGESAEAITKARAFIDQQGGEKRVLEGLEAGDVSALFLALAGLLDPKKLPCPSAAFALFPPVMQALQTRFHSGVLMMALQLNVLARRLRGDFGPDGTDRGFLASAECRAAIELLETFQNQDGSWNANTLQGALALPALVAAGLSLDDPRVERGIAWLESQKISDHHGVRFQAFGSAVWSTAFDLRALRASGVAPNDPRVEKALLWLVDSQLTIAQPEVDNRHEGVPRTGGWAFQRGNHTMADSDDAGVVLGTLGEALEVKGEGALTPATAEQIRSSIGRGRDWLFGMQNPDGGWSAFVWNLPPKKPGPAMTTTVRAKLDDPLAMLKFLFDPQPALGDPSTEDVTARVLYGLGKIGLTTQEPEVKKAIGFLRAQQCEHGGWWGRWLVNDLAATAFVLRGLRAVKADMQLDWIQRAVRWVISKQNDDGGFGETPATYPDPSRAGTGPSMAPLTGLVIQGLLDAGFGESKTVERAVAYLLAHQRPDGTWPNDEYLHANVPPDTFYCLPEAARYYPTEALAMYLEFRRHPPAPVPHRWTDDELNAARQRTDLTAEKVVSAIFARGDLAAVNDLLSKIFVSDEPIPEGLPQEARDYFEKDAQLPSWADPAQIAIAQALFNRAGWEIAMALFCSSLPQAYAAANGAQVLTQTGAMTKHVRKRIFETAQFLFDVLDEGGLAPSGRGIRAAQKVRLMHGAIRYLLLSRQKPEWDSAKLGLPINQEDLAGTLLTFSVITLDGIQRLGIEVSDEEGQAWIHTWNAIGSVLGIEESLHARDVNDARLLMDAIRMRQWSRSKSGQALIRPLIQMIQDFIPGQILDGIPVALVRHLAGDHCADLLALPPSDWTRLLIDAADDLEPVLQWSQRELGIRDVVSYVRQQIMHGVVKVEREGKEAPFRIPTSLRRSIA